MSNKIYERANPVAEDYLMEMVSQFGVGHGVGATMNALVKALARSDDEKFIKKSFNDALTECLSYLDKE